MRGAGVLALLPAAGAGPGGAPQRWPQLRLERSDDGLLLTATVKFELPAAVEDALLKGIPMFFVAEADVFRDRWYWTDKKVARHARHMRLAYQPLTRRWRLNVAPAVISNAGPGCGPEPELRHAGRGAGRRAAHLALEDRRRWRDRPRGRATASSSASGSTSSQLPRPFQIGAVGQSRLEHLASRQPAPGAGERRGERVAGRRAAPPTRILSAAFTRAALGAGRRAPRPWWPSGLVLLFLLTQATNNRELYERNYAPPVRHQRGGGRAAAGRDPLDRRAPAAAAARAGRFGSRLLVKLAAIFALVGFAPGVLIYVVSYQFVSRSIESWFDVKVEGALDAGLNLGRTTLETLSNDLANKTRIASQPAGRNARMPRAGLVLERLREQLAASDVVLWSASRPADRQRRPVAVPAHPERPTAQQLRNVRSQRSRRLDRGAGRVPAPRRRAPGAHQGTGRGAPARAGHAGGAALPAGDAAAAADAGGQRAGGDTRPTANTRSARWRATACAACTSAR